MTAQVYIILDEAKNVLTVPAAAVQTSNRPQRSRNNTSTDGESADKNTNAEAKSNKDNPNRPKRLELTEAEKALVKQGKASVAMVRVLQADGSAQPQPVLLGLNNRVTAQVIRGLKQGDKVVIADGSDTSNDSAKRSNRGGPMRM
jgi:hypothetical protein